MGRKHPTYKDRSRASYNVAERQLYWEVAEEARAIIFQVNSPGPPQDAMTNHGVPSQTIKRVTFVRVSGTFAVFPKGKPDGRREIKPIDVEEIQVEDIPAPKSSVDDAVKAATGLLKIGNGTVTDTKWHAVMSEYSDALPEVMIALDLVEKDGVITRDTS